MKPICKYGCGDPGIYKNKDGTYRCNEIWQRCPIHIDNISKKFKGRVSPMKGTIRSNESIQKSIVGAKKYWSNLNNRKIHSEKIKEICKNEDTKHKKSIGAKKQWSDKKFIDKMSKIHKNNWKNNRSNRKKSLFRGTIKYVNDKYLLFSKIEEMRYNPDKLKEKEIQVHCKNHKCINSKENNGWFTPTGRQLECRISEIENYNGNGGSYFYCSYECKKSCTLYNKKPSTLIKEDRIKAGIIKEEYYTPSELQIFREQVIERENYICEYCGEKAEHVHHIYPKKLYPGYSLDPDFGLACCVKCHYEKGHKDECSTGKIANIICT